MTDFDDLDTYNGDTEHDMWVDFDSYENTGKPDVFDVTAQRFACEDPDLEEFIDNLNDWD